MSAGKRMACRTRSFYLFAPVLLALSACSAGGTGQAASVPEGALELAVSETCIEGSHPQCESINGESIMLPTSFERAGVESATVVEEATAPEGGAQLAVDVTFDDDGASVFHTLTKQAAEAGAHARLILKVGDQIEAAVAVMQALEGDHVRIMLSPDDRPQRVVDLIQAG